MSPSEILGYVFLDLAAVVVVARIMGRLFVRIGQPAVVGEIVGGLLLGPTALGALPGNLDHRMFPLEVRPYLSVLANLGLALFMFIVGLEVDLSFVKGRARLASSVSLTSVALPFGLGAVLATVLYAHHDTVGGKHVSFAAYTLFLGVAMSITAFPVLARILADRGAHRTPLGVLSLACAAVDDVLAWSLLAVVVAVTVGGDATGVARILLETVAFGLAMGLILRRLLALLPRWRAKAGRLTPDMLAVVLVGVLLSARITDAIGIHFIFGAFVFGVIMPRKDASALTHDILESIERVSVLLLLPVFFVVTGLGVDVGGIGWGGVWQLALVLVVAISGKFVGASVAARLQHVPRRRAQALGILMNTRGLTELVILQVGAGLGVLDGQMFSMLVVMAVVTTMMTAPLLNLVYPNRLIERDVREAEQAAIAADDAFTIVVATAGREDDRQLVELGAALRGHEHPARVVLAASVPRTRSRLELASGLGNELMLVAETTDRLRRLEREVGLDTGAGLHTAIATQLGDDPRADLAALAERSGADVLICHRGWAGETEWPPGTTITRLEVSADALAAAGTERPTLAVVDDTDHARAALRLAVQLTLVRGAPLWIRGAGTRGRRRAATVADALTRGGVTDAQARDPEPEEPLGLIVVPVSAPEAGDPRSCIALAGAVDRDRDLEEVVGRLQLSGPVGAAVEPRPVTD